MNTPHDYYVFLYYFIYDLAMMTMSFFDIRFKKGKRIPCLVSCMAILMITVMIVIFKNVFVVGDELTPWWFYLSHIACIIPLILFSEGNPVLNWLDMFIVSHFSLIILDLPVAVFLGPFTPNPQPIRYEQEWSQFYKVFVFALVELIILSLSLYTRSIFQKIISRKWLANTVYLASLLPIAVLGFYKIDFSTLRASLNILNGALALVLFPVLLIILLSVYALHNRKLLIENYRTIEEEYSATYEKHKQIAETLHKTSVIRHDLRNHLATIEYSLSIYENNKTDYESIQQILLSTNEILEKSRELNFREYTSSPALNSILAAKKVSSAEINADLILNIEPIREYPLNDYNLVSLISNLLDNALEAVEKIPAAERRIILNMYRENGYFCISLTNTMHPDMLENFNSMKSSKADALHHGYGTYIINTIALKHDGYFRRKEISESGECLSVSLPTVNCFVAIPESKPNP